MSKVRIKKAADIAAEAQLAASERIRAERDRLLASTDHLLLSDSPRKDDRAIVAYRQALRDITKQKDFPQKIDWPDFPS